MLENLEVLLSKYCFIDLNDQLENFISGCDEKFNIQPYMALYFLSLTLSKPEQAEALADKLADAKTISCAKTALWIGSAWYLLKQPFKAIAYLKKSVELNTNNGLAQARTGACYLILGEQQAAQPHLEKASQLLPNTGGVWLNLARAYLMQGQLEQATQALQTAAPLKDKDEATYLKSRVEVLLLQQDYNAAEVLARAGIANQVKRAHAILVLLLSASGQHDQARLELHQALDAEPNNDELLSLAVGLANVSGRFYEAAHWLQQAIVRQPESSALWSQLALLSSKRFKGFDSRIAADKALQLSQKEGVEQRVLALCAQAHVLENEEQLEAAEQVYQQALQLIPTAPNALGGLGHLLMLLGRIDEAVTLFEQLCHVAPLQGWSQLINARKIPDQPEVIQRLETAAYQPSLEGPVRAHLLFTLAKVWEQKADYSQAWRCAEAANEASKKHLPYCPAEHRSQVEHEMAFFSTTFMQSRQGYGDSSHVPVFILGMPRSGTTLVEQILGSHSQVFGAGELSQIPAAIHRLNLWEYKQGSQRSYPECLQDLGLAASKKEAQRLLAELQALAPDKARIVDKLPHNFEHIGFIKLLFPNAKIIHLKREPRDVAISNYFIDYAAKFGGMGFAYDQSWIGEQLVDHQRLMNHWHQVFPEQILEVDYDLLVEDVESWAHRIIDYLQLPWEETVLSFQKLERAVKTASSWQVRQPIYTSSKAKWKRYAEFLSPLEAALAVVPNPPEPLPLAKHDAGLFSDGMALLKQNNLRAAQLLFEQLLQANPNHAAAHHYLGACLQQQGKLKEALPLMDRSTELLIDHSSCSNTAWHSNAAVCHQDYARKLMEQGQLDVALSHLKQALQHQSKLSVKRMEQVKPAVSFDHADIENLLWQTLAALAAIDVHVFPQSGTLLGLIRDGHLLPFDKDLDVGLPEHEFPKAQALLLTSGWKREETELPIVNPVPFRHIKTGIVLDLCLLRRVDTEHSVSGLWLNNIRNDWQRVTVFPNSCLALKQVITRYGKVWMLQNPEQWLTLFYGDWRTPNKQFNSIVSAKNMSGFSLLTYCYALTHTYLFWRAGLLEKASNLLEQIQFKLPEEKWLSEIKRAVDANNDSEK